MDVNKSNLLKISNQVEYWDQNYSLCDSVKSFFNRKQLSDVHFIFEHEKKPCVIYAHSLDLCRRSPVFAGIFENNIGNMQTVPVKKFSYKSFYQFIKYLYTDECDLNKENMMELLHLSQMYEVNVLRKKILKFIEDKIVVENVCKILNECTPQDLSIIAVCLNLIEDNFDLIINTESFLYIKKQFLDDIMNCTKLKGRVDRKKFTAIMHWCEKQCKLKGVPFSGVNKRNVLSNLLYIIRFPKMTIDEFSSCLKEHPDLLTDEEIGNIYKYINGVPVANIKFLID